MKEIIENIFKSEYFINADEKFLSEKDFQFNLARMLREYFKCVLIEFPLVNTVGNKNQYKYVDIYCKKSKEDKEECFIELKYKTKEQDVNRHGLKNLKLHDQGAHYDNRFYVYQDIAKLEAVALSRENCNGYMIFLTNDKSYQSEKNKNFPLNNKIVKNKYEHRKNIVTIKNDYTLEWKNFTEHKDFKYLLVEIQNKERN